MSIAYLSLGSNLGDRIDYLARAVSRLTAQPHTRLLQVSSVYETEPQGKTDQPSFLNLAVKLETDLTPIDLLAHLQAVERSLGRERKERWGPRTIDIDILLYDDVTVSQEGLTIPHPRMTERAFVLVPLLELTPTAKTPATERLTALSEQGVALHMASAPFHRCVSAVE